MRTIAQSLGLTLSMWTNTFADTAPICKSGKAYSRTASSFKNATKVTADKVVVLGHVNPFTAQTVKLLAAVIDNYAGRGFQFVTIPEMVTGAGILDHREKMSDIEINPLVARQTGKGVVALDIRVLWR
mgnify:CR=1 FL=1